MTEEEIELDTNKPWALRKEYFDALKPDDKTRLAKDWVEAGMQLPTEREVQSLPLEQQHELLGLVKAWFIWAGKKPPDSAPTGRLVKELIVDRDGNGRLTRAAVYKS